LVNTHTHTHTYIHTIHSPSQSQSIFTHTHTHIHTHNTLSLSHTHTNTLADGKSITGPMAGREILIGKSNPIDEKFGQAVSIADVTGDGIADILVGGVLSGDGTNQGVVAFYAYRYGRSWATCARCSPGFYSGNASANCILCPPGW
jgi:hypothetical protein